MSNNVYIINRSAHDFSDAKRFGELIFCTEGTVERFDTSQMFRELSEALSDSQPTDYLLLTSLPALCCVACAIFAAKHQCLNLLLHRADGYIARSLYLKNL